MTTNIERVAAWKAEWLATEGAHWGDNVNWTTAEMIAERLDGEPYPPSADRCLVPPLGWRCTRMPGHEGPCAAVPC